MVCGYQGSEEDADKLLLTDRLLQAVLAEAQVVCVRQLLLVVRDLNADPGVILSMAKGISACRLIDLALAHSLGPGMEPDAACRFRLDECAGTRRDSLVACPNALAASVACVVTDRWFSPRFSIFSKFGIRQWVAEISCPCATQPFWPACLVDTPNRSCSSSS